MKRKSSKSSKTGSHARNPHEGSRSELLARYVFTAFGAATPILREEDWGLDLFCALTEHVGQRSWAKECYTVQIKSTLDPWEFNGEESVAWFVNHPLPLFLCVIDKSELLVRIYPTITRFEIWIHPPAPKKLRIIPMDEPVWKSVQSIQSGNSEAVLRAPTLKFELGRLADKDFLELAKSILRAWIKLDERNLHRKRAGIKGYETCIEYKCNELPRFGARFQSGRQSLECSNAIIEHLEAVSDSMWNAGDTAGAVKAALVVRHLTKDNPLAHGTSAFLYARLQKALKKDGFFGGIDSFGKLIDNKVNKLSAQLKFNSGGASN